MAIDINDIKIGQVYETSNNQHRYVLELSGNQVTYCAIGGNVNNAPWNHTSSTLERFADACSKLLRECPQEELNNVKTKCNLK